MTWFDALTGFPERSGDDVRSNLRLDGTRFTSLANNRTFDAGSFATPTLSELRSKAPTGTGRHIRVEELVGDVRSLHQDAANENAVFQVASQFNCLEMAAPHAVPEDGVGIYQNDLTQGPACSICAGAGTIYRNYFVDVNGHAGQSRDNQIDCLSEFGRHFGNRHDFWQMENRHCFPTSSGLAHVENHLSHCDEQALDELRGKLKVGIQSTTQVTKDNWVRSCFVRTFEIGFAHDETHASEVLRRASPRHLRTESKWWVLHCTVMQMKSGEIPETDQPQ